MKDSGPRDQRAGEVQRLHRYPSYLLLLLQLLHLLLLLRHPEHRADLLPDQEAASGQLLGDEPHPLVGKLGLGNMVEGERCLRLRDKM